MTEGLANILGLITGLIIVLSPFVVGYLRAGNDGEDRYTSHDWSDWEPKEQQPRQPPRLGQPRTDVRTYQPRHQRRERPVPGSNGSKVQMARWIQARPVDDDDWR